MRQPMDYNAPILVVDDQPAMVELIARYVRRVGFTDVDQSSGAEQALNMMRQKRYRVVISDLNMQPLCGLDLLRSVRADNRLRNTRFIMATGDLQSRNVGAARELGVNSYLLKPFSQDQLRAKIAQVL